VARRVLLRSDQELFTGGSQDLLVQNYSTDGALFFADFVTAMINSLFGWLVADGWCWFVLREEYCWLVAGGWFDVREKYCWLVADKPSEQGIKLVSVASIGLYPWIH
jgi:hypothetical protein